MFSKFFNTYFQILGIEVPSQIVPVPASVKNISFRSTNSSHELVFLASELPPMGYKSYYISRTKNQKDEPVPEVKLLADDPSTYNQDQSISIGNKVCTHCRFAYIPFNYFFIFST